jgi:circadian clock protein KaiC
MDYKKVETGITKFDEMLCGGFIPGSANLLEGAPGTGKTTMGMQFIYNGIKRNDEAGLIITFEEFPQQFYHDALQLGWDLKELESQGKLKVIFTDPETALKEISDMDGEFVSIIEDLDVKRVLVDSMTHFEYITDSKTDLREIERTFINSLKREGVTSILLRENDTLLGPVARAGSKIPFIVDTYILMRYVEIDSTIEKALLVLKMRGSDHHKGIKRYFCGDNGIEVEDTFDGREGIMSGITHHTPQDAFVDVFGKKKKK